MVSWRQKVRDLEKENDYLKAKIEELEKRLLAYENAHTPPSKLKQKPPRKESSGKLGAPIGHPKYERKERGCPKSFKFSELFFKNNIISSAFASSD